MSFPQNFIDELLARTDLVALINRYTKTPLKKSGRSYKACCPFHEEKTPSFSVSPDKGLYYCFGCHASGGAIKFLMEHQRMTFPDAVEELAHQANMEVPRQTSSRSSAAQKRFAIMHSAMDRVAEFYQARLKQSKVAQNYLAQRGITAETAADFAMGYAPAAAYLRRCFGSTYNDKVLAAVGLIARGDGKAYEKFRGRLMFPIRDRRGQVIAFGGRLLQSSDKSPKYMNSPETPLFKKRNTLYGIHELKKVRNLNSLLFVEGYMDAVSLAQHGIRNVVATLGTATSQTHIRVALQFSSNLIFCFDGDTAGRQAAVEAAKQALSAFKDGCNIDFMFLPADSDPDSYIRQHGYQQFRAQLSETKTLADFLFEHYSKDLDLNNPAHASRYVKALKPLLKQLPQGVFRELLFARLAQAVGMAVDTLKTEYPVRRNPSRATPQATQQAQQWATSKRGLLYSTITVALRLVLDAPQLAKQAPPADKIRALQKPGAELLSEVIANILNHQLSTTAAVIEHYRESPHQEYLSHLLATSHLPISHSDQEFEDTMRQLEIEITEQQIERLQENLTTQGRGQKEINDLLKHLHVLKNEKLSSV